MKSYNKKKPLIFIHIPKCGGTSVNKVLRHWFGDRFLRHGFNKNNRWYRSEPYDPRPGFCISGHFNWLGDRGIHHLYPRSRQFISFIRDPFEIALSQYFFRKKKGREKDCPSVEDFFQKHKRSILLNFLPEQITPDNYKRILSENYIYLGLTEDLQISMDMLAGKLGFPETAIQHANQSPRNESVPDKCKTAFMLNNPLEYLIYQHIMETYKK